MAAAAAAAVAAIVANVSLIAGNCTMLTFIKKTINKFAHTFTATEKLLLHSVCRAISHAAKSLPQAADCVAQRDAT